MRIVIQILLLLAPLVGLRAQHDTVPEYLQISPKAISAGINGLSTPLFNISKDGHEVYAKVVFLPKYIKKSTVIYFYIKENNDSIVQELKQIALKLGQIAAREKFALTSLELRLKAYPEDIWTNNVLVGNLAYSMIGMTWDEQEEQEYILISFPLHASISYKYNSRKNHSRKLLKLLQNGIVLGLDIRLENKKLNIPLGFPLHDTLNKMEEEYRKKKS